MIVKILWKDILYQYDGIPVFRLCIDASSDKYSEKRVFLATCVGWDQMSYEYILTPLSAKEAFRLWNGGCTPRDVILDCSGNTYRTFDSAEKAKRTKLREEDLPAQVCIENEKDSPFFQNEVLQKMFHLNTFSLSGECLEKKQAIQDMLSVLKMSDSVVSYCYSNKTVAHDAMLQIDLAKVTDLSIRYLMSLLRNLKQYFEYIDFCNVPEKFSTIVNLVVARLDWEREGLYN